MDDSATPSRAARIWRHPGTQLAVAVPFVVVTLLILKIIMRLLPRDHSGAVEIALGTLIAAGFVGMYVLFCRLIERRRAKELAPRRAVAELGTGLLLGGLFFTAVMAVIWAFGGYSVVGANGVNVLAPIISISLASGFPEEIVFRGLLMRLSEKWFGTWAGLGISSVLFGLAHLGNGHVDLIAVIAIAEAGVMLGAVYLLTRRLWMAIAVHAAWNFTQGGIFGVAVSGGAYKGLLVPGGTKSVSTLVTGGEFGAEASLPAVVVLLTVSIVLLVIAYRRGRFIAPMWVRRRQGAGAQE